MVNDGTLALCLSMKIQFVLGVVLIGTLAGCVRYVDRPRQGEVYVAPRHGELVLMEDEYIYYPTYQVYYSNRRHCYIYLHGHSWVTRPAPPRVSVDVFLASPSVRMDFHNAPAYHHREIVRQYPRNWAPPSRESDRGERSQGDWRKNDRYNHGR